VEVGWAIVRERWGEGLATEGGAAALGEAWGTLGLREVVAVAQAKGIALDYDERWAAITGLLEKAVGGKASMLQDVEAGRRTEIEVINGAVASAGREAEVPTPANDTMVALITALQSRYLAQATSKAAA